VWALVTAIEALTPNKVAAGLLGALDQRLQLLKGRRGRLLHDDWAPASNESMASRKWEVGGVATWITSGRGWRTLDALDYFLTSAWLRMFD
jgi:hypothetical protein